MKIITLQLDNSLRQTKAAIEAKGRLVPAQRSQDFIEVAVTQYLSPIGSQEMFSKD